MAGSLHICSGPGTAGLSCRSHQGSHTAALCTIVNPWWGAGAAFAVLCFSPLCLWEVPVTTVAFLAVPAFSIKPVSHSQ